MAGDGFFTNTEAVDVFPVPPFVEPTVTELFCRPVVEPVTFTVSVQDAPAASVTPLKLTTPEPAVAVAVPPHVFESPFGLVTVRPAGKLSVKLTPVRAVPVLGFRIENVNAVDEPVKMGFAVKDLAITGGSITVSVAVPIPLDVVFGPVAVEETLLLTFGYVPAAAPVTVTLIVQVPLAAIVPLVSAIVRGAVRVSVPPLQAAEVADATVRPEGRISEKETPVKEVPVFGFVNVKVSVLVVPVPIEIGEKLLERFGAVGRAQPVKVTSSIRSSPLAF